MNRREFLKVVGCGVVGLVGVGSVGVAAEPRGPNILLVIGDDMTWRDCEPYGNPDVHTPNLTRLAREGMCLDGMFTSTGMCSPTRQQLYTGLFPVRSGAYPNHSWCYDSVKSFVQHFKARGYRVGLVGKTHVGPAKTFSFEKIKGKLEPGKMQAVEAFINRDKSQPYFLVLASNQPHGPWNKGDASVYNPAKLDVPPYLVDCAATREALVKYYAEISYLDSQLGACLKRVEKSGQVDDTIVIFTSEQGSSLPFGKWTCYENGLKTAFIVRWPGKVKAGSRSKALTQYVDVTPTLIEAAGGDPKTIDTGRPDARGHRGFDGQSFLKVLLGHTDEHREFVYGIHTTRGIINGSESYPIRSVRSNRYKYILNLNHESEFSNVLTNKKKDGLLQAWFEKGKSDPQALARAQFYIQRPKEELYDLKNDPYELTNIASDHTVATIKTKLKKELERWMAQQSDEGIET
ncbi:MAG: sulfatase, partial [Planctomycetes bacterium]|nr:sulfatase [Planctomycetota bacterium]